MQPELRVEVHTGPDGPVVVKTADDPAGIEVLEREAGRLRRARHPGVVELLDHAPGRLTLAWAGAETLELVRVPVPVAAGILAALAATLADLHELGIVHGRLTADHVVVGGDGRPRVAGLRGPHDDEPDPTPADDVAAVGRLVDLLVGPEAEVEPIPEKRWTRRRWSGYQRRALQLLADQACDPDPARRPTMRALANAVAEAVPEARLPLPVAGGSEVTPDQPPGAAPAGGAVTSVGDGPSGQPAPDEVPGSDGADRSPGAPHRFPDRDRPAAIAGGSGAGSDAVPPPDPGPAHPEAEAGTTPPRPELSRRDTTPASTAATPCAAPPVADVPDGLAAGMDQASAPDPAPATDPAGSRPARATEQPQGTADEGGPARATSAGHLDDDDARGGASTVDDIWTELRRSPTGRSDQDDEQPVPLGAPGDLLLAGVDHRGTGRLRAAALAAGGAVAVALIATAVAGGRSSSPRSAPPASPPTPAAPLDPAPPPSPAQHGPAESGTEPGADAAAGRPGEEVTVPAAPAGCEPDPSATLDVDGDGCTEAVRVAGGTIEVAGVRYAVGDPGDVVAVGDWDCDGMATPGLVRPGTGEVFLFPAWAREAGELTVEPAATVPGARALVPPSRDRCAAPDVRLADGGTTPLPGGVGS